jgi:MtN3 and saliva related transmembrane protein
LESTWIGYGAAALTVISYLPQAVRAWRTGETHDLSLAMFLLLVAAGSLWLTYGVMRGDWPVIVTNASLVLVNIAILAAKLRNG